LTLRGGAEMTVEPLVATNKVVKTAGLLGGDSALEEPAVLGGDDVEGKICTWDHSVCKPGSEYYCQCSRAAISHPTPRSQRTKPSRFVSHAPHRLRPLLGTRTVRIRVVP